MMKEIKLIKEMLSVNKRIIRDASRANTTWLRRPELKIKKVFNQQISRKRQMLMEVMYRLSEKGLREVNELETNRGKCS